MTLASSYRMKLTWMQSAQTESPNADSTSISEHRLTHRFDMLQPFRHPLCMFSILRLFLLELNMRFIDFTLKASHLVVEFSSGRKRASRDSGLVTRKVGRERGHETYLVSIKAFSSASFFRLSSLFSRKISSYSCLKDSSEEDCTRCQST